MASRQRNLRPRLHAKKCPWPVTAQVKTRALITDLTVHGFPLMRSRSFPERKTTDLVCMSLEASQMSSAVSCKPSADAVMQSQRGTVRSSPLCSVVQTSENTVRLQSVYIQHIFCYKIRFIKFLGFTNPSHFLQQIQFILFCCNELPHIIQCNKMNMYAIHCAISCKLIREKNTHAQTDTAVQPQMDISSTTILC